MKITTWNVNGIRAALNKGMLDTIKLLDSDVYCIQEIKARPEQFDLNGFEQLGLLPYWNPAERPGYSGVGTLCKNPKFNVKYGLGVEKFDTEGRVIRHRLPEFYLYNVYFPNGQRGLERVEYKLDFYQHLLYECQELMNDGEQVIICGDFNTAHREIDLANPKENTNTSGFLQIERDMIDKYLANGFTDIYRYLYPDKIEYTWWTYRFGARNRNIGWRIDYFLVSNPIVQLIKDVQIFTTIQGSDHCPVTITI